MNTRHTEQKNITRDETLRESAKQGVFIDEFGGGNPAVNSGGSCKPATIGPLAGICIYGGPCKLNCRWRK